MTCIHPGRLALALLLAASCSREHPMPGGQHPARPRPDRVTMNFFPSPRLGPAFIAQEEGFFAQEGIEINFANLDQNSALLGLTSGRIDVYGGPIRSGILNIISRGSPLRVVADQGHAEPGGCSPESFVASDAIAASVARSGYRHQRVAMVKGGISEFLTFELLAQQHLTYADVEVVEYPAGEGTLPPSNQMRSIDAIRLMPEPRLSAELSKGASKVIRTSQEVSPGHQADVIVYGSRLWRDNPALGRRFMRAWLRGVRQYREGKTERNVAILARGTGLPPDLIRRVCWWPMSADGRIRPEAVAPFFTWMHQKAYLEKDLPMSAWYDPSFIEAAGAPEK